MIEIYLGDPPNQISNWRNRKTKVKYTAESGLTDAEFDIEGRIFGNVFTPTTQIDGVEYATEVTVGSTVTEIGDSAFALCDNLAKVTVSEGVASIGVNAFLGTALSEIRLPSTLAKICCRAFDGCYNLEEISIPSSVSTIEQQAFSHCGVQTITMVGKTCSEVEDMNYETWFEINDNPITIHCTDGDLTVMPQSQGDSGEIVVEPVP